VCKEIVPDQVKEVKNANVHKDFAFYLKKNGMENLKNNKTPYWYQGKVWAERCH
jgi:hypothetical protein